MLYYCCEFTLSLLVRHVARFEFFKKAGNASKYAHSLAMLHAVKSLTIREGNVNDSLYRALYAEQTEKRTEKHESF